MQTTTTHLETSHWLSLGQISNLLASLRRDDLDRIVIAIMNLQEPGDTFDIGTQTWWVSGGPSGELSVRVTRRHKPPWLSEDKGPGYDLLFRTDNRAAVAALAAAIWSCWGSSEPLLVNGSAEAHPAFSVAHHFIDHPLKDHLPGH